MRTIEQRLHNTEQKQNSTEQKLTSTEQLLNSTVQRLTSSEQKLNSTEQKLNSITTEVSELRVKFSSFICNVMQLQGWNWSTTSKSHSLQLSNGNRRVVSVNGGGYMGIIGDPVFKIGKHVWNITIKTNRSDKEWIALGVAESSLITTSNIESVPYSQCFMVASTNRYYQMTNQG